MNIRKMVISDYDEAHGLWEACDGIKLNATDDSKEGIKRFLLRNPDTCFVAVNENKIVGTIMAGSDGRRGYIYHTAVDSSCRGMGMAKGLVDETVKALERVGIRKAAVVVLKDNEDGDAFWEKEGFTKRDDLIYRNRELS